MSDKCLNDKSPSTIPNDAGSPASSGERQVQSHKPSQVPSQGTPGDKGVNRK